MELSSSGGLYDPQGVISGSETTAFCTTAYYGIATITAVSVNSSHNHTV